MLQKADLKPSEVSFGDGYEVEASQNGVERFVFMHNPCGIRLEYNISRSLLELWISPQARQSIHYRDRNFSNRDDHTRLFDRIFLPYLPQEKFVSCEYDPFHSVLRFAGGQAMHIVCTYNSPMIEIWFDKDEEVDLKCDKADIAINRVPDEFCVSHPDRGKTFTFCAILGAGTGVFAHQRTLDEGRSIYARARMSAGQTLVIGGELAFEPVREFTRAQAGIAVGEAVSRNESDIAVKLKSSVIIPENNPRLLRQFNTNKRVMLSCQDHSGSMRASLKFMYYLIWQVDGCMTGAPLGCSGWVEPLTLWNRFSCSNPVTSPDWPGHTFFGQLVNKIGKWEEHGNYLAVKAAFVHWTQSGDPLFARGVYFEALAHAMKWLEAYVYSKELGAFGAHFVSEQPYYGSRDYGWDEAVGRIMKMEPMRHKGELIRCRYDLEINTQAWESYLMLASMCEGSLADEYLAKARALEKTMLDWAGYGDGPGYGGYYLLDSGAYVPINDTGRKKPVMGNFFGMHYWEAFTSRQNRLEALHKEITSGKETFATTALGTLCGMDTEFVSEEKIMEIIEIFVACNEKAGTVLPMAYAMHEKINFREGGYHDTRPQLFSIGPFQQAVVNLMVRRTPFGIAVRNSQSLRSVAAYEYRDSLITFTYAGAGLHINRITVNGNPCVSTLQIPLALLEKGDGNTVVIDRSDRATSGAVLVWSTVELLSVAEHADAVTYQVCCHDQNTLLFRNPAELYVVTDSKGAVVKCRVEKHDGYALVHFDGRGVFTVTGRKG